jgi:transposase
MDYNIPEEAFQKINGFLITVPGIHAKNESKIRVFLEAVFYLCRAGCQIRMLPEKYGNCFSIYQKFLRWKKRGIWKAIFEYFQEIDDEWFIRANQCAADYSKESNADLGRRCAGFSTKIHALVDALGNPVKFVLSPGNERDVTRAEEPPIQV